MSISSLRVALCVLSRADPPDSASSHCELDQQEFRNAVANDCYGASVQHDWNWPLCNILRSAFSSSTSETAETARPLGSRGAATRPRGGAARQWKALRANREAASRHGIRFAEPATMLPPVKPTRTSAPLNSSKCACLRPRWARRCLAYYSPISTNFGGGGALAPLRCTRWLGSAGSPEAPLRPEPRAARASVRCDCLD